MIFRDTLPFRALLAVARKRHGIDEGRCRLVLEMISAATAVRTYLRHELGQVGLTELDLGVLVTLYTIDPSPATLANVAAQTGATRPGMTEVVDRLEGRSLVRRERDTQDRRLIYVHLTDAGRTAAEAALTRFLEQADALASRVPPAEFAPALSVCSSLTDSTRTLRPAN